MHVYDIEDALERDDRPSMQHAFRVLIDYPHCGTVQGARGSGTLDHLLERLTSGLLLDATLLPPQLRLAVERVAELTMEPESSYAQAAVIAFEFRTRWQALYSAAPV